MKRAAQQCMGMTIPSKFVLILLITTKKEASSSYAKRQDPVS